MAAIVHPKWSDAPMHTSTATEASTSVFCGRLVRTRRCQRSPESPAGPMGDDYGVAALHPFHPAEIEVALGDRGPYCSRDVWASLGPIEAESAKVAAGRTQLGKLDPELGEKTDACSRDFSGFDVEHDVFAGDERIGEINAEAAGKVVVANSGRTERACLRG